MIGNNAICYQRVQTIFRNAVVGFLRPPPVSFPDDREQRLKQRFGEDWEKLPPKPRRQLRERKRIGECFLKCPITRSAQKLCIFPQTASRFRWEPSRILISSRGPSNLEYESWWEVRDRHSHVLHR